nr:MAG TPA: hypothetical protein [Caudoviricetes sp.]
MWLLSSCSFKITSSNSSHYYSKSISTTFFGSLSCILWE